MASIVTLFLSAYVAVLACSAVDNDRERSTLHRLVAGHVRADAPIKNDLHTLPTGGASTDNEIKKTKASKDDEKKTLSQQVADGKYGLIQREIFKKPLKRPGIISYDFNPETPKDTIENLGGLNKEEIWLAENHLLVIKGGNFPQHEKDDPATLSTWPAIDNYTAPKRPVKIPLNPKVPPPFPVRLADDAPLQILGSNATGTLPSPSDVPPLENGGYVPGTGPFFPSVGPDSTDAVAGGAPNRNAQGPPRPPTINDFDEDDPSIYYPPPYTFYYPSKENGSAVPAGPLVPGIILPPPPDFFGPLNPPPATTTTTAAPTKISPRPKPSSKRTKKPPAAAVTILKPILKQIYYDHPPTRKPFLLYGPPPTPARQPPDRYLGVTISTTTAPLKLIKPAPYYYYEDETANLRPPSPVKQNHFYNFYTTPTPRPEYVYVTSKPRYNNNNNKGDTFERHLAKLKKQIHYFTSSSPKPAFREIVRSPRPVYQYSFQAANYQPPRREKDFRPSPPENQDDNRSEGFRPMPKYSVQIGPASHLSYDGDTSTERPAGSQRFYATTTPEYRDDFGRRIPHREGVYLSAPRRVPPLQQQQQQQPLISLHRDTLVNYVHPLPNINPEAELIHGGRPNHPGVGNYVTTRPNDAERGSFISYTLPGDNGAHFYFLTPQLAQRRDQGAGFYYERSSDNDRG